MSIAVLFFIGCGAEPEVTPLSEPASDPAPAPAPQAKSDADTKRQAVVKEVIHTEKYTFARMDACGQEAWVAGPVHEFAVEDTVEMSGGLGMQNFHSDTLDRDFEMILFVDGWSKSDKAVECRSAKPPAPADKEPEGEEYRVGKVKETVDAAGYTYARLDVCGKDVWIAAPTTSVEVGSYGATPIGSEMKGFHSKSLERDFESIWFVQWIKRATRPPRC